MLHNYYRRRRPLDLQGNIPARVSFLAGVLRSTTSFRPGLSLQCGKGSSIKFRKDRYTGDLPLALAFLSLFAIALDPDAYVGTQTNSLQ